MCSLCVCVFCVYYDVKFVCVCVFYGLSWGGGVWAETVQVREMGASCSGCLPAGLSGDVIWHGFIREAPVAHLKMLKG